MTVEELLTLNKFENNLPTHYALRNPFPNPFNPITKIQFDLPEKGYIRLNIFDINGKLIKTLTNQEYKQGRFKISWNAKNDNGQDVSSGMYFIRLVSENYSSTKKILF